MDSKRIKINESDEWVSMDSQRVTLTIEIEADAVGAWALKQLLRTRAGAGAVRLAIAEALTVAVQNATGRVARYWVTGGRLQNTPQKAPQAPIKVVRGEHAHEAEKTA